MNDLLIHLKNALDEHSQFFADNSLIRQEVSRCALSYDPLLIELLLRSPCLRSHFFT